MSLSPRRSAVVFLVGGICVLALLSGTNGVTAAQKGGGGGGGGNANNIAPLQVFDSGGQVVGTLASDTYAGRLVGNTRVFFLVDAVRIPFTGGQIMFPNSNCTGSAYVQPQHALLRLGYGLGTRSSEGGASVIVYPAGQAQLTEYGSVQTIDSDGNTMCSVTAGGYGPLALAAAFNLPVFTGPFDVR